MIPVFRPAYDEREVSALRETLLSGWIGLGPKTCLFEEKFAKYLNVPYCLALNSATAALHLSMHCLNLQGAEVITTPMTFVSTNHAILYVGAKPVFCDVEPDTMNIDATKVERLITSRTKAVVCVHYGGRSCDMDVLLDVCRRNKLFLIEDCAHAAGGRYKNRMLGSIGDLGCFSFHAVKNIATGDGGMISTSSAEYHERIKRLRWLGITADTFSRGSEKKYNWQYDVVELGFKSHMNDISAVLGLVQLEKIEELNNARRRLTAVYDRELNGVGDIELLAHREYQFSAAHNYVIKTARRDELNLFLKGEGVSTGVHYYPNHLYEMYKPYYRECPVVEHEWRKLLTLPLYPDLKDGEIELVISLIRKFYSA